MTPTTSPSPTSLQHELGKRRPFEQAEQEAHLNLVRTESMLRGDFDRLFDAHGLSGSSFNILRILRGARLGGEKHGKPCHEIGERMVARVPDITRLVDRLEKMGLVERARCTEDRRVVYVAITQAGLDLLKKLDEPVLELHRAQLGHMSRRDLEELSRLLTLARSGRVQEPHAERGGIRNKDQEHHAERGGTPNQDGNPGTGRVVNRGSRSRHSSKDVRSDLNPGSHAHTPVEGRPRRPGSTGPR